MKHDKKAITAMVTGMAIGAALVSEAAAGIVAEPTWQKIYVDGQQVSMTAYTGLRAPRTRGFSPASPDN